jgi:hypothetical protein
MFAGHPDANICARVPAGVAVIDIDPRHGGDRTVAALERTNGPLPTTLTVYSGRGDGGNHRWYRHPGGRLRIPSTWTGVDLKLNKGYVMMPSSIYPDSGEPYWYEDATAPIVAMPAWLVDALRPDELPPPPSRTNPFNDAGWLHDYSIADWFTEAHTWSDVLAPHGWRALDPAGTRWLHPAATSELSATVRHDCLFVYSTSTPFEPTAAGDVHGYTKFRAWAVLNHRSALSAAARAARELRTEQVRP